ncbi:MAG: hypothetical protein NZ898_06475 [Myxococcota bacterium]|nr:hypothetical protein [Myxococcota bacterium]
MTRDELMRQVSEALDRVGSIEGDVELLRQLQSHPDVLGWARDVERLQGLLESLPLPARTEAQWEALALRTVQRLGEPLWPMKDPTAPPQFDEPPAPTFEPRAAIPSGANVERAASDASGATDSAPELEPIELHSVPPPPQPPSAPVAIPPRRMAPTETPVPVAPTDERVSLSEVLSERRVDRPLVDPLAGAGVVVPGMRSPSVAPGSGASVGRRAHVWWAVAAASAIAAGFGVAWLVTRSDSRPVLVEDAVTTLPPSSASAVSRTTAPAPVSSLAEREQSTASPRTIAPTSAVEEEAVGGLEPVDRASARRFEARYDEDESIPAAPPGPPSAAPSARSETLPARPAYDELRAEGSTVRIRSEVASGSHGRDEGGEATGFERPPHERRAAGTFASASTSPDEPAEVQRRERRSPRPRGESTRGAVASLPDVPSRDDVLAAMRAVEPAVAACRGARSGVATVQIVVGSSGRVRNAVVTGPLAGTPEGSCVARAVRAARFPQFAADSFTVTFPFRL